MNSPDNHPLPHKRHKQVVPLGAAFLVALITVHLLLLLEQIAQLGVYSSRKF